MNKADGVNSIYNNKLKDLFNRKFAYVNYKPTCSSAKECLVSMSSEIREGSIEQFNIERVSPRV